MWKTPREELQLLWRQEVDLSPEDGVGDTLLLLSEVLKPQIPPPRPGPGQEGTAGAGKAAGKPNCLFVVLCLDWRLKLSLYRAEAFEFRDHFA